MLALTGTLVFPGIVARHIWLSTWSLADRLAGLSALFAGAALYVAALGGIIALAAYGLASKRPAVRTELRYRGSALEVPIFPVSEATSSFVSFVEGDHLEWILRIYNKSTFPARNPAVRVQLSGFAWTPSVSGHPQVGSRHGLWHVIEPDRKSAQYAFIWMAEPGETIHGPHWFRDLPPLDLRGVAGMSGHRMQVHVAVVAEGARTDRDYTPRLLSAAEWIRTER
jgi:hypothetical protein